MIFRVALIFLITVVLALPAQAIRCPSGTFKASNATCQICPAGTWRNAKDSSRPRNAPCIPCRPGRFNPYPGGVGLDLCRPCPRGTFTPSSGSTSCQPCPPGTSSNFRAKACLRCGPGTAIARNSKKCEQCQKGLYSSLPNNNKCLLCPKSMTSPKGATSVSQCTTCPPGQSAYRSKCQKCRVGEAGQNGQCEPCGPGQFSDRQGATKCDLCPPGTFQGANYNERCKPCRNGTTTVGFGNTICREIGKPCNKRFFEDDMGDCRSCEQGYRLNLVEKKCEKCPPGSVSPGGVQTICVPCKNGQIPNSYNSFCGCPRGMQSDPEGGCEPCPPGRANSNKQPTRFPCFECEAGTFAPEPGSVRCERCPPNMETLNNGATKCVPCPEGTVTSIREIGGPICVSKTTRCPPGFKRVFIGARDVFLGCRIIACTLETPEEEIGKTCALCEPGTFLDTESNKCRRCKLDEVSSGGLSTECTKCPAGQAQDPDDASKCSCRGSPAVGRGLQAGVCAPCPAGSFGTFHNEFCEPCPPGTFSKEKGMEECTKCPIDFVSDKEGAARCTKCPRGTISDLRPGGINCIPSPV